MSVDILIEDIVSPIEVTVWSSKREALEHLELESRHFLEVGGEHELPREYLCVCSETLVLMIGLEIAGVYPHLLGLEEFGLWLLGCNTMLYTFEPTNGLTKSYIDLTVPFYAFKRLNRERVLAAFETGVLVLDQFGDVVWQFEKSDILVSHKVEDNQIHLMYAELGVAIVDVESGMVRSFQ